MVEFESNDVFEHSLYGYLFLKHFTPLSEYAEVLLYHHAYNIIYQTIDFKYKNYANLIHLADRIDVAAIRGFKAESIMSLLTAVQFDSKHIEAFAYVLQETKLYEDLAQGVFREIILNEVRRAITTTEEALHYLKMLVHSIDFKSRYTATHSIYTTVVGRFLAEKLQLGEHQIQKVYFAGMVHDIGKMGIPSEILEFPGRFSFEQMEIMKKHVEYTEELLSGVFPEDIVRIAVRHHEKLNGSGYPHRLKAEDLSIEDRILAVADIFSALIGKRSYKDAYDFQKAMRILSEMVKYGYIDGSIVQTLKDNQAELKILLIAARNKVMVMYESIQQEYHVKISAHDLNFGSEQHYYK